MVYALVTIYNPEDVVFGNLERISNQVDKVYILDNSLIENAKCRRINKSEYIPNFENLGLSRAFNRVLKNYSFNDEDFIIFFDQDSTIDDGYIEQLVRIYENNESKHKIGALGPVIFDRNTNKTSMSRIYDKENKEGILIAPRLITSSLLCRYKNLRSIDFWDESIFLDWADFDLSYRLQALQLNCCVANTVMLNHCLGDNNKKCFGKEFPYYSPIREYYQIRDSLRLAKKKTTPFKEKIGMMYVALFRTFIHFVVFDKKRERLCIYWKAYMDFVRNRTGEYEKKCKYF